MLVSNPPFLPFMGYLLYKLRGINYVILVHDVFPEKAIKLNYIPKKGFTAWAWTLLDKKSLQKTSGIIAISESMKSNIENKLVKYNFKTQKDITVIHNWADAEFIKPIDNDENTFIKENSLGGKFIIQYSGNIGASYELEVLVEAARSITDSDVLFLFIGDGVKKKKLSAMAENYSLKNVMFLPYQKRTMLPHSLTAASVSIITYEKEMEGLLMPSKLYTTLASGKPVISFCTEDSEVGKIICHASCGFSINPDNVKELLEKISFLRNNPEERDRMGKNARKYFEENFTLEHSLEKYINVIKKLNR